VLLLAACSGPPAPPEPKVAPQARILGAESRQSLSSFTLTNAGVCQDFTRQDRPLCQGVLTFSSDNDQLASLEVGQVLVSQPTPAAPYGLLQKVTGISRSGGQVTVQTEEANLGEAIQRGRVRLEKTLKVSDLQSAQALAQGVRFGNGLSAYSAQSGVRPMATLDFSFNEVLHDQDGNPFTTADQVRAEGKVFFDAQSGFSAGVDIDIDWSGVDIDLYLKAALGIKQSAQVKLTSGVGYSLNKSIQLAKYNFEPIVFFVGPVPVVLVPQLVVSISGTGQVSAGLSFAANQNLNAQACMEYKGGFKNCSSFGENFSVQSSVASVNAKARASLLGQANLLLYGLVGPYAKLGAYLELDAQVPRNPLWKLDAGVEAFVGLHLGVDLGVTEIRLDWDVKVLDKSLGTLAQSSPQPPSLSLSAGGLGQPQIQKPFSLCASAFDPQDGARPVILSASPGGALGTLSPSQSCLSHTFTAEGPVVVTATASNSLGLSTSRTLSLNVQDPPPSVQILNPKANQSFYAGQTVLLQGLWLDPSLATQECAKAVWRSNVAGDTLPANACGTPKLTLSSSTALRTLTLEVTNARGKKGLASVNITVLEPLGDSPPVALITQPSGSLPELSSTQIVLRGWVQDKENQTLTYTWKIAELNSSGVAGPEQNVPGGSGSASFTSSGTDLTAVIIANLQTLFSIPGACGKRFRLFLEVTDGVAGPARPVRATQDFTLPPCIN